MNSVCHNCAKRTSQKTCESTCPERQAEIKRLEEAREKRYQEGMEFDSKGINDYWRMKQKRMKQGRC